MKKIILLLCLAAGMSPVWAQNVNPPNRTLTSATQPQISVNFPDRVRKARIWVDGTEFTTYVQTQGNVVLLNPPYALDYGTHHVQVQADRQRAAWSFTIANNGQAYHPEYHQPGYNQPGYHQPGYHQPGYNQPGYSQPGYNQPGYYPGHTQPGYQSGYYPSPQPAYYPGYNQPGYNQPAYYPGSDPDCRPGQTGYVNRPGYDPRSGQYYPRYLDGAKGEWGHQTATKGW